jgi:hypothetical protein
MRQVAKWFCRNCKKIYFTEDYINPPQCNCDWYGGDLEFCWVDFEPTKRVWDMIKANKEGNQLKYHNQVKESMKFTATLFDQEYQERKVDTSYNTEETLFPWDK